MRPPPGILPEEAVLLSGEIVLKRINYNSVGY
jgi:hypothetical protein